MKIIETFIKDILITDFPSDYEKIYDNSLLLQYLDRKMNAIHGNSKTRRSLANIYAIYSIIIAVFMVVVSCKIMLLIQELMANSKISFRQLQMI